MHKQMKAAQLTELNEEFIKNSQLLENYNCSITFELNEKDIQHGLNYLPQAELTLTKMTLFPSHLENKMFHFTWLLSEAVSNVKFLFTKAGNVLFLISSPSVH